MFASVVTGQGTAETEAQAAEYWKNLKDEKGYLRGYMVVDRKTGKWMTFNLWETEAAARGHETGGGYARDVQEATRMGASSLTREVFEVVGEK